MPIVMLSDNGSVRENATRELRKLAASLCNKSGLDIHPVSLKFADRIPAEKLDGIPARIFKKFMSEQLLQGEREFILLPLFFGQTRALTSLVAQEIAILKQQFGDFKFTIAQPVYPLPEGEDLLTKIIYDYIQQLINDNNLALKNIVVVDHGSPNPQVTEVRKHLVNTVQKLLPENTLLEQAVMERREGKEYDFNGDLLKHWLLKKANAGETSAIVILMFFLPGKHAGKGGDIEQICDSVTKDFPRFKIYISPLITEHNDFISILLKRLHSSLV